MKYLLNSLMALMVFTTIACSHKRGMEIDGGLSAEATTESSEESVAAEPQASSDAVAPTTNESEPQAATEDRPSNEDDLHAMVGADQDAGGGDLSASLDEATQSAMNTPEENGAALMAQGELLAKAEAFPTEPVSPPISPVDAVTSTLPSSEMAVPVIPSSMDAEKKNLKSPRPKNPNRVPSSAKEIKHSAPKAPTEAEASKINAPLVMNEEADKIAAVVKAESQEEMMKEALEEQKAQEASAGISSFLEKYVFWVAATIIGSVIAIFFIARKRKEDGFNL